MEILKRILLTTFLLLCIAAASFAGWKLYEYYRVYQDGKKEYERLEKYVEENDSSEEIGDKKGNKVKGKDRCPVKIDFEALKKINPETVGWIHIPDTGINYPIVQAKDNKKYLHRTFEGKDSHIGAIFLDVSCKPDFSSFNSIIYGHNLKNGEMFGHLKKLYDVEYNKKADYKKHPDIWVITPENAREYEIFAFREIHIKRDSDVYTVEFSNQKEREAFIERQIIKSQKSTGIKRLTNKGIVTLSTCTSRTQDGRFVVQAVKKEY